MNGRRVDIGGRALWVSVSGRIGDRPTVVLEAGWGQGARAWAEVVPEVARLTCVVAYDRAGVGASDRRRGRATCGSAAVDLHALLGAARLAPPYVLVGHSYGGMTARVYAARHPSDVAGVVLVDPMHEDQETRMAALLPPDLNDWLVQLRRDLDATEPVDQDACDAEARDAADLGDRPLVVLSGDRHRPDDAAEPLEIRELAPEVELPPALAAQLAAIERSARIERLAAPLRRELHGRLARLSSAGRLVLVPESGHDLPHDAPGAVVEAIRRILEPR